MAILKISKVEKSFGPTRALRGVDLEIEKGEIHALIGENGAGKSTLMKILSGVQLADAGQIELEGKPFYPKNPLDALHQGVAMIYQELNLARHLPAEENIVLGQEPQTGGWVNGRRRLEIARTALGKLKADRVPLGVPVNRLSIAQQQLVEIARALVGTPKVLIMDEPTSSLTQADTEHLFDVIQSLAANGVSVIYISHFLEEANLLCKRFTILRDGATVATGELAQTDRATILKHMVGRDLKEIYPRVPHTLGKPVLEVKDVIPTGKKGPVTFTIREGEIFGFAGLVGAGRTETLRTLFGLDKLTDGSVALFGKGSDAFSPQQRLRNGCGMVSEDRKEEGLMLQQSIADNMTITRLNGVGKAGFINNGSQNRRTDEWIQKLSIRCSGPTQPIRKLSGGNQQKVAIGRLLYHGARLLLLDEPTRGIDVGSKAQIYEVIGNLAVQGVAVLITSSYLPELLGICDTIGVMSRGALVEIRPASAWSEVDLIEAAVGTAAATK
jgi:ribose transport system ATP-binding protein